MTSTPPFPELLDLIAERSDAFRSAAFSGDPQAVVPGCPQWSLRSLITHLGAVQRWWATIVTTGPADGPAAFIDDPGPVDDLLTWSAESTQLLLEALRAAGPDRDCWTWWGASEAPQDSGAVARHQVQEAGVHAYDAQESIGRPEPIPLVVAVDTIDEFLVVTLDSFSAWPHAPVTIGLSAAEGPGWLLELTAGGARSGPLAGGSPPATVRGSASDLVLGLYQRIPLDRLTVDGDRAVVRRLLDWADTE